MEDDGFWQDVKKAYEDCVLEGLDLPESELWECAKRRARERYFIQDAVDKAKRTGEDFGEVLLKANLERLQREIN